VTATKIDAVNVIAILANMSGSMTAATKIGMRKENGFLWSSSMQIFMCVFGRSSFIAFLYPLTGTVMVMKFAV
jgi:hypothetical protein